MQAPAWAALIAQGAAEFGLSVSPEAVARWHDHLRLLLADSRRAGLTAITDPAEIAIKHFLDSLACLLVRDIRPGDRVADIGSGGGFPGLALAVARPRAYYALIESNRRRAAFLSQAVQHLGATNVAVVPLRAEEAGQQPDHRESYHLVVSRALAPLPTLLEYCLPLARVGGHAVAYKGPRVDEEIAESAPALNRLGGRIETAHRFRLPRGMGERTLLLVEKTSPTPPAYPRRPGLPAKRPLRSA